MASIIEQVKWHIKNRYLFLFISMGLFILLPPFIIPVPYLRTVIYLLISLVIINCTIVLFDRSRNSRMGLGILLVSLLFIWLSLTLGQAGKLPELVRAIIFALFFGFTFVKIIRDIIRMREVNFQMIVGAMAAYFLLGLTGAILFQITDILYPGSFSNPAITGTFYSWVYFSFVTLSTLGYGDITPLTAQGQAVAIFVSVSGQLFLAVLMAMLVGKFLQTNA